MLAALTLLLPIAAASPLDALRDELQDLGVEESFVRLDARAFTSSVGEYCVFDACTPDPTLDERSFWADALGLQSPWGDLCGGADVTDQRKSISSWSTHSRGGTACFAREGGTLRIFSTFNEGIRVNADLALAVEGPCDGRQALVAGPVHITGQIQDASLDMLGTLAARLPCSETLL